MILLRQAPASDAIGEPFAQPMPPTLQMGRQTASEGAATARPSPMEAPKLDGRQKPDWQYFVKHWGSDKIWYSEWLAQMDRKRETREKYETMPPAMRKGKINPKREGLQYIFVPNVDDRQEPGDSEMLEIIKRCLLSVKTDVRTLFYGEFGSFSRPDHGARTHSCRYQRIAMSPISWLVTKTTFRPRKDWATRR